MRDKYVFRCPRCDAVVERERRGGVVCEACHIFMERTIKVGAFEEMDPDDQEVSDG